MWKTSMGIYDRKSQTSDRIEMFPEVFPPLSGIGRTDIFPKTETSLIIFFTNPRQLCGSGKRPSAMEQST